MFYTSQGRRILRYDIGADVQLPDFAALSGAVPPFDALALRLLPPGDGSSGLLLTDLADIKRLSGAAAVVQTYDAPGEDGWTALDLDPNGTSFWAGGAFSGNVYRFNITTGAIEIGPIHACSGGGQCLGGLCVRKAAVLSVSPTPTAAPNPTRTPPPSFTPTVAWRASTSMASCAGPTDTFGNRWYAPTFDDSLWSPLSVPDHGHIGGAQDRFYRGTFTLSGPVSGVVSFDSDDGIWVYVNGTSVGHWGGDCHQPGCVGRPAVSPSCSGPLVNLDVSGYLQPGVNVIAAQVSNATVCCDSYFNLRIALSPRASSTPTPTVTTTPTPTPTRTPPTPLRRLAYYALGDSIASGHGLPGGTGRTPQTCRVSPNGYPGEVCRALNQADKGQFNVACETLACSGARSYTFTQPTPDEFDPFDLPHQVAQLEAAAKSFPPDQSTIISLTVGADDFDFVRELKLGTHICDLDPFFKIWVQETSADVERNVEHWLRILLEGRNPRASAATRQHVLVVLTDYFNPFNKESHYFRLVPLSALNNLKDGSNPTCLFQLGSVDPYRRLYTRTARIVRSLNTALWKAATSVMSDASVANRLSMVSVYDVFNPQNGIGHESAEPNCGGVEPTSRSRTSNIPSSISAFSPVCRKRTGTRGSPIWKRETTAFIRTPWALRSTKVSAGSTGACSMPHKTCSPETFLR